MHFAVVPPQPAPFLSDDSDPMRDPSAPAGRRGLPHLQISLFRFSFNGQPVGLKCSVKNKHLMLAIKFPL